MADSDVEVRGYDAVVIGAGFAGLHMLHRLRGLGLSAVVLERAAGVGGTWYWNRYPGARCDSESYYYCYSFDRDLEQEWTWTERYPRQPEIKAYLDHVADRFDLRRDIRFGTTVTGARADADGRGWTVEVTGTPADADPGSDGGPVAGPATLHCRFLITAVGCLSTANVPDLPGLDTFDGRWFHTGRWPHEGVDVTGRRVGVVGTGSTGIQAIPVLADAAAHLTVLQRTPNYSIPARNGPLSGAASRSYKDDYPAIRAVQARSTNGHPFVVNPQSALEVDAAERDAVYRAAWERGGLRFRASYADLLADAAANETASEFLRDRIREIVHDPVTAQRLVPHDHGFATKRPPIDTGYFETYNRPDVTLVDVRADPVQSVVPEGVRLRSGTVHELDDLVFATGFDAFTGPLLGLDPVGPDGTALRTAWRDGPRSYLGLAVSGFPNLFTITGPFSPSVLTNMPTSIEQHVDWIADCLAHLLATGADRIEAEACAEATWGAHNRDAADATLLPRAGSWYLGANVPGKPAVFLPYAGGFARYAATCADVAADGYRGFRVDAGGAAA